MARALELLIAFVVLALVFGAAERLWPAVERRSRPRVRAGAGVDLCYWFFNPIVTKAVASVCVAAVAFALIRVSGIGFAELTARGFGPVAAQPWGLVVLEMLVLGDLVGYWIHRAFHAFPELWDVHAVHHSSEELDWLSAVRVHPLNDVIAKTLRAIPFVLLGFPLTAVAAYVPILTLLAIFVHANVPWRFGPLRYVIASPFFHRWHHTSADEGMNANFAGLFPFIDWLFGTLYMPAHQPTRFGVRERVPPGFLGQLRYPFGPDPMSRAPSGRALSSE